MRNYLILKNNVTSEGVISHNVLGFYEQLFIAHYQSKFYAFSISAFQSNHEECVRQQKNLIQQLPEEHYIVLQYLIRFLVMVAQYESTNKMNSMALAIVFGPNLFR